MTFCLGMKSRFGLVAIADTRITSGSAVSFAKKIQTYRGNSHGMFIMASGLRSVRDKALTYFDEHLASAETTLPHLYLAANALAGEIRRVRDEDEEWLTKSGLSFDLHVILGGQMADDPESRMYLIYPDGTWIEVTEDTPYALIGESSYGKPVLDRSWRFDASLEDALTIGLLAFDATRASTDDVGPPLDTVLRRDGDPAMREHRFSAEELEPLSARWSEWIARGIVDAESVSASLFAVLEAAAP
ncbi:MAG: peptidase [Dehalococcoidia bacterium]|nr:MAG: peptidase [Dehalococcoidia bacterium]